MKTKICALVATSLVASTSFAAERPDKTGEEPGVAAGAVIGAVLGGPVGFVVGGGLGGWLSNKLFRERRAKEEFQARYQEADALAGSLEELLAANENELEQTRMVMQRNEASYRHALGEALDVEVYFRTGESTLDERTADRIERLGGLMRDFGNFDIVVEGHADPRGEDDYNEELSAARAASVREALMRGGLPSGQISVYAAGEYDSAAAEGDLDAMALERRVDLTIVAPPGRENRVARK